LVTGENIVLNAQDGKKIIEILDGNWRSDGTPACDNDFEMIILEKHYFYHSDCGTLFDRENRTYLFVEEEHKDAINQILFSQKGLGEFIETTCNIFHYEQSCSFFGSCGFAIDKQLYTM